MAQKSSDSEILSLSCQWKIKGGFMACDLNRRPVGLIGIVSGFAIGRGLGTLQKHTRLRLRSLLVS